MRGEVCGEVDELVGFDFDGEFEVGIVFVGLAGGGVDAAHGQHAVVNEQCVDASL